MDSLRVIGSTVSDFAKAHPQVVTAITGTVSVLISCKNQTNNININVIATPDQNPTSIANSVSKKMQEFSGAFLYDSIGEVP